MKIMPIQIEMSNRFLKKLNLTSKKHNYLQFGMIHRDHFGVVGVVLGNGSRAGDESECGFHGLIDFKFVTLNFMII